MPRFRDFGNNAIVTQTTQDLVDAIRMLERAGIVDHSGHCSARREPGSFYINSGASIRCALTVADIISVRLDGSVIEGTARPPLEFHIHSEIYRARLSSYPKEERPGLVVDLHLRFN